MAALLGLDIGTSKICGVALSPAGEILATAERSNDAGVAALAPNRAEQDPTAIRAQAFAVLHDLAARIDRFAGIGLTGQMHGLLCVDAANRPIGNLITWQDRRCLAPAAPDGRTWLDLLRARVAPELWTACGCEPASGYLGSTLFWLCHNHALPPNAARVCFIHDWIAGLLSGQLPSTDPSDAGSAGIFDLVRLRWHDEIVRALELPAHLLPPVRPPGEVIGHVTAEMAAATGLRAGTPVCNALGDNQAGFLGSVADAERSLLINLGTGGQICWAVPSFLRVPGMETRYLPRTRPGAAGPHGHSPAGAARSHGFLLVGASLCGGRAYAWLNDTVRGWLLEAEAPSAGGRVPDRDTLYARLNELATAAPAGSAALRVTTTFSGTRAKPAQRGSIGGISLDNFTLGNVARAVLEGIVEELCSFYDRAAAPKLKTRQVTVVASGNTVRKNPLLHRIIAERLGRSVVVPRHREEAAYGAALLAGVGTGLWGNWAAAAERVVYE